MTPPDNAKRGQHDAATFGLEVGRDKGKLFASCVLVDSWQRFGFTKDADGTDATLLQTIVTDRSSSGPCTRQQDAIGSFQPLCFRCLDPLEIRASKHPARSEYLETEPERAA